MQIGLLHTPVLSLPETADLLDHSSYVLYRHGRSITLWFAVLCTASYIWIGEEKITTYQFQYWQSKSNYLWQTIKSAGNFP